jgi:protein involved in polysaccharide export with SLBB domain
MRLAAKVNRQIPFLQSGPAVWTMLIMVLFLMVIEARGAYGQANANVRQGAASQTGGNLFGSLSDSGDGSTGEQETTPERQFGQGGMLSSDQIISTLQQDPGLLLELKSQLADRLRQQGIQVDPNDISDQTLFGQIAANERLRSSISAVLRARGVATDDDFRHSDVDGAIEQAQYGSQLDSRSLPQFDSGAQLGAGSRPRSSEGIPGVEITGGSNSRVAPMGIERQGLRNSPRRFERTAASTDPPIVVQQPTPFDFQSLHDLYAQIPNQNARLERFGSDVFVNRTLRASGTGIAGRDSPLDVPLGPDYIIGPGDRLTIDLWGGVTQAIMRTVDRDGRILLPEAGAIQVAGLPLGKVQDRIEGALKPQFRNAQIAVTVSGLRSVRVYVVGDVQRPGGYDISSLATPLSILYAAGGPTAAGSLRTLRHLRGNRLVEEVDLYDFLLHGIRNGSALFQSGDTLLVPPAGAQVAVSGAVKRPAIYELLRGESTLATVVEDAGGFTSAAALTHIRIERIDANNRRETVTLPNSNAGYEQPESKVIADFRVKDGDRISVEPILPYSQRAIYLTGHVARPGRLAYADGMRLGDVLRSYQDMLPEPAVRGEIVRLVPPDLHAETIDFSIPDVLIGNTNPELHPFDTIRVFGRYETDAPKVTIRGEVLRPGDYPMFHGMTASQLVRMAGGFKRDALTERADLTSYEVEAGHQIVEKLASVRIGAAVSGSDPNADVTLKPGDILAIHQITDWTNIGESVTIRGQVRYPGNYGFQDGERLSSVLRRAGGLLPTAYPAGAVLIRSQVKSLEESSRDALVRQIQATSAAARLSPGVSGGNSAAALQLIKAQQDQVLADLQSHPPTGRMVIHITSDIDSWADTSADVELRRDDVLTIPKKPGFVLVTGQVYNVTALTFAPGKTAGWYLRHAGGTSASANRKEIFVIRANGSVVGRRSGGFFDSDVLSTKLNPGDVVVVPQKIIGGTLFWRNLLTAGQLAASTAITAGVAAAAL